MRPRRPDQFCSVDQGIYGHLTLTLRKLAILAEEKGDLINAAELCRGVRAECPGDHDAETALQRLGVSIA